MHRTRMLLKPTQERCNHSFVTICESLAYMEALKAVERVRESKRERTRDSDKERETERARGKEKRRRRNAVERCSGTESVTESKDKGKIE